MAIVRWEPAGDVASLQQDVNRVFASFFDPSTSSTGTVRWIPPVDLEEMEESYLLVADLPGVAAEDVAIEVEDDVLTLSGARTRTGETDARSVRSERGHGAFQRRLTLPEGVDPEQITASFDRGVLEVRVPKPVKAGPRRVSIQVGGAPSSATDRGGGEARGDAAGSPAHAPGGGTPEPAGAAA